MIGILVISFLVLLFLGIPIFYAMGISSLLMLLFTHASLIAIPQKLVTGSDSFTLMAVPFFLLAGELMHKGGLAEKLIYFANSIIGHFKGGLGAVTVVAAMFFAALSGSAPATTASVGSVMIPEMEKRGYKKAFAAAIATAAGPIGQIIPPSIPMIIFAVLANVSISKLFLAGVIPGVLVGLSLIVASMIVSIKNHYGGDEKKSSLTQFFKSIWDAKWALLAPVIILGGIYGGVFTPTEASVIAVVYGLVIGMFVYKRIKVIDLPGILINTVHTTTLVISIIAIASLFGWLLAKANVAQELLGFVDFFQGNTILFLVMINIIFLIIGALMDNIAAMVILVPVLLPIVAALHIDPVHFGIITIVNFAIGMATPPIGYSLFVGSSISNLSIEKISKELMPLIIALIVALILITFIPQVSLWLPQQFK